MYSIVLYIYLSPIFDLTNGLVCAEGSEFELTLEWFEESRARVHDNWFSNTFRKDFLSTFAIRARHLMKSVIVR